MKTSEFIAKHLAKTPGQDSGTCIMCGRETKTGTKPKKIISGCFNDWENMKHQGTVVCEYCAACLNSTAFDGKALRSYSVIVSEAGIAKATRKDIAEAIARPPESPYLLIVNYSQKKHAWFSSIINDPASDTVYVGTDQGVVIVDRAPFCAAFAAGRELYAGGFSKADIDLANTSKYNKIEQYGVDKYYADMAVLEPLRNTKSMQLLIWALYKDQEESDDQN